MEPTPVFFERLHQPLSGGYQHFCKLHAQLFFPRFCLPKQGKQR